MKVFAILLLVAFASAKSAPKLLGDEECTRGPSHWCRDYKSAKECGAVKYCTEHVWTKQLKGTACDECKLVIKEVHAYLSDNVTEAEVIQSLEALCSFLGTYATECKSLVETYGKEMMDMLSKYTANPELICNMLGMCTSMRTVEAVKPIQNHGPIVFTGSKHYEAPKSSALCIVCEFALAELDKVIGSETTEEKIISEVEKICDVLPSTIKNECDALIKEYGKQIIQMLINKELKPKEICTAIKLCQAALKTNKAVTSAKKAGSVVVCGMCEFVVRYVDSMLKNKKTVAEITSAVEEICPYLGAYKDECNQIAKAYIPLIVEYLAELSADQICQKLSLCQSNKVSRPVEKKVESKNNVAYCDTCKVVVSYVDNLVKSQKTEAEIVSLAEKLCAHLGSYKDECDSIVAAYLPEILQLLAQELSPDLVCKALGLCTASTKVSKSKSEVKGGEYCQICEVVVSYVENLINNNTEEEVVALMEQLCSYLGSYKDECNSLVKTYVPQIIELLKKELTPAMVCKELGLCTSLNEMVQHIKIADIKRLRDGAGCQVCKVIVGYIDNQLKDKKTEQEITAELETLCQYLGSYKAECQSLVSSYMPLIFQYLAQELTPDLVCKELGLCTAAKKMLLKAAVPKKSPKEVKGGQYCQICEVVVSYVDNLINNNTEEEIVALVGQLCSYLGSYKDECNSLVKTYVPQIIELLKKELTPALVCKELGLCTSMNKMAQYIKIADMKKLGAGAGCQICKVIVGYIDTQLKDKKTEQEITAELETLCQYLGSYKAECQSLVSSYMPLIFQYLAQELTPDLVCKELGLCTATKKMLLKTVVPKKSLKVKGGAYCKTCEVVVSYVEGLVNKKTEAEIAAEVEELCTFLGSYKDECKSLVDSYLPQIIELLKKELTPQAVCQELGLCTAFNNYAKKIKTAGLNGGAGCTVCKMLVGYVDNLLKDSKTEAEITTLVEQLCSYLGSYKAECDSLVSAYLPLIFKYLAQEMTPDLVCKELSLCTSAAPNAKMTLLRKAMPVKKALMV